MATLTRGQTLSTNDSVTNTKLHNLVDLATIADIVNADISASAAIADTKLAQITTAGKVTGTAISALTSLPSSAGLIPVAHLASIPNTSLLPISLASWVDGGALKNLGSVVTLAGTLPRANISTAHSFKAHKNGSNQTGVATNSATKVTFGTETFDTNSNFASSTFTCSVAGKYYFRAQIQWTTGGAGGENFLIYIYKNGSSVAEIKNTTTNNDSLSQQISTILDLAVSDTIEVYAKQITGTDRIIDGTATNTFFEGFII